MPKKDGKLTFLPGALLEKHLHPRELLRQLGGGGVVPRVAVEGDPRDGGEGGGVGEDLPGVIEVVPVVGVDHQAGGEAGGGELKEKH